MLSSLTAGFSAVCGDPFTLLLIFGGVAAGIAFVSIPGINTLLRSEERRVGKECRSRWSPYH